MSMEAKDNLSVAALELDICHGSKQANIESVWRMAGVLDVECDIVVLPEMFATGFVFDSGLAEGDDGPTLAAAKEISSRFQVAVCGTFLAKDGGNLYNRCFFVTPSGDYYKYDKRHLFSLGGEDRHLMPGNARCVFNYLGWNVSMFVCYDLRFPKWMRNDGNCYDLALLPANWPAKRDYAWRHLQIARAIENQAYLVSCNRTGKDSFGVEHAGNSMALDYAGCSIGHLQHGNAVVSQLNKSKLDAFRDKFKFWMDAD